MHPTWGASLKLRQEEKRKNDGAYHALLGSFWYANVNLQRDARKASRGSTAYNTPQAYRKSPHQFMSEIYTTSRNQVSSVEASPLCLLITNKNSKTTASEQSLQGERMEHDIDQKITHLKH